MTKNCIFCNRERNGTVSEHWTSSIKIVLIDSMKTLYETTVCPDCRKKKTIQDLYEIAVEKAVEIAKENMKKRL